mmetsp:Transcript_23418/g.40853  ORF Transcript_23418/g.40853 Transcript_23418/m.40853 type:complete len:438 (-) Transcript_23418:272-1585(-)|eukprot:CAMPEP_0194670142 /NCGR_PEP_ID=MMETSP0295-20121207/5017_1 /TAXON_ID=39354 /ORGANISM="Heterosigma akashiwo, Strain CCMP2393" /LENGTH=437 /DNA_ID=CAMNT_0039553291 /DNA_START=29 /DNA_END=1342 /DNA_ORIENTATION=+
MNALRSIVYHKIPGVSIKTPALANCVSNFRQSVASGLAGEVKQLSINKLGSSNLLACAAALGAVSVASYSNDTSNKNTVAHAEQDQTASKVFDDDYKESPENKANRLDLYPLPEPYRTGMLRVSSIHEIYYEESGNPHGKPVVLLHGGPGGGGATGLRRFFDPQVYRIIRFDQRGCGNSVPHACLEENTTWHSVADVEALRKHLGVDRWMVFGGSWGSCLALSYAVTYPERVTEMVLRGIFMLRRSELEFFYQNGASHIFPDAWESYIGMIPEEERGDLMAAYRRRLTDPDPAVRLPACREWTAWEMKTSYLTPSAAYIARADDSKWAEAFARIENHYFVHGGFFPTESYLLDNVDRVRHIPCVIIQGRYDVVCPAKSAWDLHRAWPEARFVLVQDAGHSAAEPGNTSELMRATEMFKASNRPEDENAEEIMSTMKK